MSDQDRLVEPERVDNIERMQGHVEHVAQTLGPFEIAVTRQKRGKDMPMPRECCEERIVFGEAAGAVQEDQRPTRAGLEHPDLAAAARDIEKVGARAHSAASGVIAAGTARCASGWIQKRSSLS